MKQTARRIFLEGIDLPQEAYRFVEEQKIPAMKRWVQVFDQDRKRFFAEVEQCGFEASFSLFLKLYLEIGYQRWKKLSKEEQQLLMDGLQRLKADTLLCKKHWGIWGILPYEWRFIDRILDGRIRRLGNLEFEPKTFPYDILLHERRIMKGTVMLNVHLPEGSTLAPQACEEAFQKAMAYYPCYYPGYMLFHIESWLVSPKLEQLCDKTDHLYQFQKRWERYEIEDSNWAMMERVFPLQEDAEKSYAALEETTKLQRRAKAMLLRGEKLQHAKAVLVYEGKQEQ